MIKVIFKDDGETVEASGLTPGEVLEIVKESLNMTYRITRIGHDHIVQRLEGTD